MSRSDNYKISYLIRLTHVRPSALKAAESVAESNTPVCMKTGDMKNLKPMRAEADAHSLVTCKRCHHIRHMVDHLAQILPLRLLLCFN